MSALYGDFKCWPSGLKTISVISVKRCLTSRSRAADAVKYTVKSGCVFFLLLFFTVCLFSGSLHTGNWKEIFASRACKLRNIAGAARFMSSRMNLYVGSDPTGQEHKWFGLWDAIFYFARRQMFTCFLKSMMYHSHTVSHFFIEEKKKNLASNIPKNQQCRCGRELVSLFKTCGCCQSFALEFHTAVLDLFVRGISDASSSWNISQDNIARLLQWIYLFSFVCTWNRETTKSIESWFATPSSELLWINVKVTDLIFYGDKCLVTDTITCPCSAVSMHCYVTRSRMF